MNYYARAGRILRATVQADHPTLRICQDALAALAAVEDDPALPDGHLGDRDEAS